MHVCARLFALLGGYDEEEIAGANSIAQSDAANRCSVRADAKVNDMWADINASTGVSQEAADKTAKVRRASGACMHVCVAVSYLTHECVSVCSI